MDEKTSDQKTEALFFQLLLSFQAAAWQQMGKVKNPLTDKIEKNLEQARFSIDMLEMIRAKSRGNLTENEKRFLDRTISELQLNYVAEVERERDEKKGGEAKAGEKPEEEKASKPEEKPKKKTKSEGSEPKRKKSKKR